MSEITQDLLSCVSHLSEGKLVAFPTETVYGLGANALNETAVRSIFDAKRRPLNDPVIVHVKDVGDAIPLIAETDVDVLGCYHDLAQAFWPGPLTIVTRKADVLPMCLTADTGWIGIRSPNHPVA
jgi:tRNA threonylcarbamoyl adenosine modification protein (Sua5/YciO/YrdC/YwlC family)